MQDNSKKIVILLADDDAEDRELSRKALDKNRLANDLYCVTDGEELMDFLKHRGKYAPPALSPTPGLILLDLNMPRKDGREALKEIKEDALLKRIPIVIMTTSKAEEDIFRTYDLGTNSYITKPLSLAELIDVTMVVGKYWFQIVTLPDATAEV